MKTYRVKLSDHAEREIFQHYLFLVEQSNLNANAWVEKIEAYIYNTLAIFPQAHPVAEESEHALFPTRKTTYGRHVILFEIHEEAQEVVVLQVRPGSQRQF